MQESNDEDNTKTFNLVIERKNKEVKFVVDEHKKGESNEKTGKENQKEAKESCGFKRAEKKNQSETSKRKQ